MPVIEINSLGFRYRNASEEALHDISFSVHEGEFVVIMGPNQAGKTTLCLTLNGLIPHLVKGTLSGTVQVNGIDTRSSSVSQLFSQIGLVFQDFESQLFSTDIELEVAFGPENLGLPLHEIQSRIERALEATGLGHLRGRQPASLSGGQKQLLAIASTLSLEPGILCFDEPTTDLDPLNKRRIFNITRHLSQKVRHTLLMVEHETEEALSADRIILLRDGRIIGDGPSDKILRDARTLEECSIMPPQLTEMFQRLHSPELPIRLDEAFEIWRRNHYELIPDVNLMLEKTDSERMQSYGPPLIEVKDVHYSYAGGIEALNGVSLQIREGEFIAILGQNGSGKTTLAKHLNGLFKPARGDVLVGGESVKQMESADLARHVGYVFQNPDHQIFEETILEEVLFGPRRLNVQEQTALQRAKDSLEAVGLWEQRSEDPFTLTKGMRQKVAVASVLATRPRAIVMDEPTTGLDYGELKQMMALVQRLNRNGHTIIMITHCIWLAAQYAHRTVLMSGGRTVCDGRTREVFSREDLLEQAGIIAPQIVRFSNRIGTTFLSVDELLQCTTPVVNPDTVPDNADQLRILREQKGEKK